MTNFKLSGRLIACAFTLSILATAVAAHQYALGPLKIVHPWSRPTSPGVPTAAGYLSITNAGANPDRLVGGSTTAATSLEIHQMSTAGGVMRMRPVQGGVLLPAGATVTFAPAGYHFMFIGPKRAFRVGDHIPATLKFEHAGSVNVEFYVENPAAPPAPMPGMAMPAGGKAM